MATALLNFPVGLIVDGILSFLQNRFSNPEVTPCEYRWNPDETKSRIRISGTYALDNQKPASIPSITVRRSGFQFASMGIDNLQSADINVFTNAKHEDWLDGFIEILCESGSASEASSLANFLAIEFQANRHNIVSVLKFVRFLAYADIGPEMPTEKNVEVRRWQVVLRLKTSVYLGWITREIDLDPFNKLSITNISDSMWNSDEGVITQGSAYLEDATADFGTAISNIPQLLDAELSKKWYYVLFGDDPRLYTIEEITSNHKIKLSDRDINNDSIPYNPTQSATGVTYKIVWNTVHIKIELPKH